MKIYTVSEEYKTLSRMENCISLKCAQGKMSEEHQDVMSFKEPISQIVKKVQPLPVFLVTRARGFIMIQMWQDQ